MIDEIIAFTCGVVLAFLTLKALRSFGTRSMAFALAAATASSYGASMTLYVYDGTGYTPSGSDAVTIYVTGGGSAGGVGRGSGWNPAGYGFSTFQPQFQVVVTSGPAGNTAVLNVVAGGTCHFYMGGGSGQSGNFIPPTITNFWNNGSITNTNSISGDYLFLAYTNGALWLSNWYSLGPNEFYAWNLTNDSGSVIVEVVKPGGPGNDYMPESGSVGSSGSTTGTNSQNNGSSPVVTSNDPFAGIPLRSDLSTNTAALDRQNAEGIVKAIGAGNAEVSGLLRQIATNGNTAQTDMSWTNILKEIATNTLNANLSRNELLKGLTNVAGTNLIGEMFNFMTNFAGSNYHQSEFSSGLAGISNGFAGTFTNVTIPEETDALTVQLGRGFSLNLNPIRELELEAVQTENFNPLRNAAYHLGQFVKYWLQWGIYFCAFWICFQRTWDHAKELLPSAFLIGNIAWSWSDLVALALVPFTGGLSVAWPILKRTSSIIAVILIAVVVALLPTLAWIVIGDYGFTAAFGGEFSARINESIGHSGMLAIALQVFYVFTFFFPITTFAIAVVNVFGFRFYLVGMTMLTWTMLKGMHQVSTANQLNSDGSDRVEQLDQGVIDV